MDAEQAGHPFRVNGVQKVIVFLAAAVVAAMTGVSPALAAPGTIINASLEADVGGDGVPDCFTAGGWGTNVATFTRVNDAHSGTWAEKVDVSSYSSGDRKLLPTMTPGCAPTAIAGGSYTVSAWYHSTIPVSPVLYALRSTGWEYWLDGAVQPASAAYRRAVVNLPPVPAGVTAVSFGLAIYGVGNVVTDDYAITLTGSVPCPQGRVALSYDDGPSDHTSTLLDSLAARQVRATFFLVGEMISTASEPVVRRELADGHIQGNHSWSHPRLTQLNDSQVRAELTRLNDHLLALGSPRPNLWRPPYSATDSHVDGVASGLGMTRTMFAVDTGDADDPGVSASTIRQRAVDGARSGAIIIMHDIVANSVTATPGIIDDLRARGFCFGVVRPSATFDPVNMSYVEIVP